MTFQDVLNYFRADALTQREQGNSFEKLIKKWLLTDPRYPELTHVWLWNEFPARQDFGGKDLGIDLVARTDFGGYWAIQCKFQIENTSIDKPAVDSFLSTSSRLFTDPITGEKDTAFVARLWISTTEKWNTNAEESIKNQAIPVTRIGLETFEESSVDWDALVFGKTHERQRKTRLKHQTEALVRAKAHYADHDRGKLIMACGTGKTFTALSIIEQETQGRGRVLFMVPSIALLGQALNAWMADATYPIKAICICSDPKSSQRQGKSEDDTPADSIIDLAKPATTNSYEIAKRFAHYRDFEGLLVVFSTYQSIDAVSQAQQATIKKLGDFGIFDWIVCDEAHRTTGVKLAGKDESAFTKIHDTAVIQGRKRVYMTATPRLYGDTAKAKAIENDRILCSMDDMALYGQEFYRVGFSYAVQHGLLSDYKVLVLTVGSEFDLPPAIQVQVRDKDKKEIDFDMASRLIGCINGLSKNLWGDERAVWDADPRIMRRALAFCPNINKKGDTSSSMNTEKEFPELSQIYWDTLSEDRRKNTVRIQARHIDGTMNSQERSEKLAWLKGDFDDANANINARINECRLLCNVRCLSEGVDVPALDAVIFLSAKSSQIDVVQSVGRVMRNFRKGKDGEKKYGYIIIPVVVNPEIPPEEAMDDNERFAVVWSILNALRSHDESFNAIVNSIALNKKPSPKVTIGGVAPLGDSDANPEEAQGSADARATKERILRQLTFQHELKDAIYARMVEKVGDRFYWEKWAKDVGVIAHNFIGRITEMVSSTGTGGTASPHQVAFQEFVKALRATINTSITDAQAVAMLAQHLITKPVFDVLFKDYQFAANNAVSQSMEKMIDILIEAGMEKDTATLNNFYESVRTNIGKIDNLAGKQTVIKNLYEKFFKGAFSKTVEQLGIVYTPVECVDFILRSVNDILHKEFDCTMSDEQVHILDPFAGTGTFITRLLQSGLIREEDIERKYLHEIHCNEIVLLAYYVADVNIESVFHDITGRKEYLFYDNICLTDTFTLNGRDDNFLWEPFRNNVEAINRQRKLPIRVIVGNPPYSVGQNLTYPTLDARIEQTYVAASSATLRNSLYDSYIRAFRWASDRIQKDKEGGVIGFITNGGWLDGNAAAGLRKCFEEEFTSIYVLNLRGDANTSGELRKKEGGGIFGAGSRAPVVITLLVYNPAHPQYQDKATIYYHDIGDYLKRDDKLDLITQYRSVASRTLQWTILTPNEHGDWLNQRTDLFGSFILIGDKQEKNIQVFFEPYYSRGVATSRDAWSYNYSKEKMLSNMEKSTNFFNNQLLQYTLALEANPSLEVEQFIDTDSAKISWSRAFRDDVRKGKKQFFARDYARDAMYRPFCKNNLYFNTKVLNDVGAVFNMFPTSQHENLVICAESPGGRNAFSTIITNKIPDLHLLEASQCFPLYWYKQKEHVNGNLMGDTLGAYNRKDGITDWVLKNICSRFQNTRAITKEHIFYYVYGILHSPDYRQRFNADLKKSLPRIPIVDNVETFMTFSIKGKELADLHLNYEAIPPHPDVIVNVTGDTEQPAHDIYRVEKMRFADKATKACIIYNSHIRVENIPPYAYDYIVNGRSAIEWIMESYRIKVDKDSGICNDPNDWAKEHNKPRYILDLLLSVVHVSTQSVEIVRGLPRLEWE